MILQVVMIRLVQEPSSGFGSIIDAIWSGFLWNSFKNFVNPPVLSQEEIFENMDTNGDGVLQPEEI